MGFSDELDSKAKAAQERYQNLEAVEEKQIRAKVDDHQQTIEQVREQVKQVTGGDLLNTRRRNANV